MTKGGDQDEPLSTSSVTCTAMPVDVEGKQAVWIFTEFETDEPLKALRDWLVPEHWPDWGGEMFKEMRPIGPVDLRPTHGNAQQTHAEYLEVVEIGGHRLETELRCELKSAKTWAAMSYDLDRSIGAVLQVDRGYLMAADVCGRRHVKALKVVGFTDTLLNTAATQVCPEWSTWVQRAVKVEAIKAAGGSVDPKPGSVGDSNPTVSSSPEGAAAFTGGVAEQWISTVTDMVEFYAPFTVDVSERLWSGRYGREDAANDTSRLFQRLARDWSRAWQAGMESAANWAEATVRPTARAEPARSGRILEHTTLMVQAPSRRARVGISDLARIGRTPATIKATDVTITPPVVEEPGPAYVTIQADTSRVPCGLYEGALVAGVGGERAPALFFVSHAQPVSQ
ncbi:MAG TPA: hypothetical protein VEG62_01625 [Acidimicrobiales bacterium]|nr:hypothetical protein [Acidimicrobiales bacterium]HXZ61411.1 hypothetical protein [Acidimicrobiales bacterium]